MAASSWNAAESVTVGVGLLKERRDAIGRWLDPVVAQPQLGQTDLAAFRDR
jgi:hypothetical protein